MTRRRKLTAETVAVAIHRGEAGALEALLDLYEGSMYSYAQSILQNAFDAQEVVQDAVLRAHKALTSQYDEARCRSLLLKPWLLRTVRNLALNKRRSKRFVVEQPLEPLHDRASAEDLPDLETRQEAERVRRAVATLPADVRELIVLRFVEELSYEELAKTTGATEAALRGKVFRALKLLRSTMEDETTGGTRKRAPGRSTR